MGRHGERPGGENESITRLSRAGSITLRNGGKKVKAGKTSQS